jgi:GT2 family glycosyltransferase
MNVLALALAPAAVADAIDAWDTRLGADDRGFVLTLGRSVTAEAGWTVHPLELDRTRSRYWRRALLEASSRWPSPANPAWRWLLERAWPEIVWHVRSFDPDVVDVRRAALPAALAARLAAAVAPIALVTDRDERAAGRDASWRRYDPSVMVSIVLPVYCGGAYLRQALDGCLSQTHRALELIVVDDCSPDETPAIVAEYARRDARVVAIRTPENLRLPGALNAGFARARGELLTWTSHDNYHAPRAIETLVQYLCTWPDVNFVYSACHVVDADDRVAPDVWYQAPPWHARFFNPVGPYFLYRRRVWEATGQFRRDLEYLEDYEYWVRVSKRFAMMRLPYPLYYYRLHADSMTSRAPRLDERRQRILAEHFPDRGR